MVELLFSTDCLETDFLNYCYNPFVPSSSEMKKILQGIHSMQKILRNG
jgi:hypothetical protein